MLPARAIRVGLVLVFAGCDCSQSHTLDAGPVDAPPATTDAPLTPEGCADPALWRDLPAEPIEVPVGSGPCAPAQFPLFPTYATFRGADPEQRSCWRVVAAHPASGFEEGAIYSSEAPSLRLHLQSFDRPVSVEGRLLRPDGSLDRSGATGPLVLEPERVEAIETADLVGLGSFGDRVFRDRDANGDPWPEDAVALAQSAGRPWLYHAGHVWIPTDEGALIDLGAHERVVAAPDVTVAALDGRRLVAAYPHVAGDPIGWSLTLEEDARQIAATYRRVWVLGESRLFRITLDDPLQVDSAPVAGTGRLVRNGQESASWAIGTMSVAYWDGAVLRRLAGIGPLIGERLEYPVDAVGAPLAIMDGVVIAERGFALGPGVSFGFGETAAGPSTVTIDALFEGATRISHVASDLWAYVVETTDGSHTIHGVPHVGFCGP